jgi:hypothetical protein
VRGTTQPFLTAHVIWCAAQNPAGTSVSFCVAAPAGAAQKASAAHATAGVLEIPLIEPVIGNHMQLLEEAGWFATGGAAVPLPEPGRSPPRPPQVDQLSVNGNHATASTQSS